MGGGILPQTWDEVRLCAATLTLGLPSRIGGAAANVEASQAATVWKFNLTESCLYPTDCGPLEFRRIRPLDIFTYL